MVHCKLKLISGDYLFHKIIHPDLIQNDYARNRELEKKKEKLNSMITISNTHTLNNQVTFVVSVSGSRMR